MKSAPRSNLRALFLVVLALFLACASNVSLAQQRREPVDRSALANGGDVYAARRARVAAQTDAPVILWGFTGREEISQASIFAQEDNFYYLTGHNEEGAGLVILPALKPGQAHDSWDGPREILFLPAKSPEKEKW